MRCALAYRVVDLPVPSIFPFPCRYAWLGRFSASCGGAAAVEFALVSSALIMTILFVMFVAVIVYFSQALDYATTRAARQIMIGAVQKAGTSQSGFQTLVCSYLPAAFSCGDVIVNVQTASKATQPGGYYAFVKPDQSGLVMPTLSNGAAQYSPGAQSDYEYVQVVYPITFIPAAFASLTGLASYNGSQAYLVVSTTAFRNEQY